MLDRQQYLKIFEQIILHYSNCDRWKIRPKLKECHACWQISSILTNIRALCNIHPNQSTDFDFHNTIKLKFIGMRDHNEQMRVGKVDKLPKELTQRPKVARVE